MEFHTFFILVPDVSNDDSPDNENESDSEEEIVQRPKRRNN